LKESQGLLDGKEAVGEDKKFIVFFNEAQEDLIETTFTSYVGVATYFENTWWLIHAAFGAPLNLMQPGDQK
jgi:hypothetical protein